MVDWKTIVPAISRRAEQEEKARLLSHEFSAEAEHIMPNNSVAQAMAAAQSDIRIGRDEIKLKAEKMFEILQKEANLPSSIKGEFEQATQQMLIARDELCQAMEKQGTPKKERVMPDMFPLESSGGVSEERSTANAVSDTIEIIDRFKGLFEFIPINNDYVHIVIGVLKTISDATLNHRKIGKGFQLAIEKVGREMQYCGEMLSIPTPSGEGDLRVYVAYFFIKVFAFLIPYTKWCASRCTRFKASLDSDFYETNVQGPLGVILAQTRNLERRGNLETYRTVSEMKIEHRQMHQQMMDSINANEAKRFASQADAKSSDSQASLDGIVVAVGQMATQLNYLTALSQEQARERAQKTESQRHQHITNLWTTALKGVKDPTPAAQSTKEGTLPFIDIEIASRHLEISVKNGYPINFAARPEDMPMASQVFKRVQEWMSTLDSERLWLHGPAYAAIPSQVSLAAASIVLASEQNKVKLIAYRVRVDDFLDSDIKPLDDMSLLSDDEDFEKQSAPELERMVSMVYSLIRQMVWLLPDHVVTKANFSYERFDELDGTVQTLPQAYDIFEELLALMPSLFLCIIDGIQLIDCGVYDDEGCTADYLDRFLDILWRAESDRTMKVLLVSDGLCPTLSMSDDHIVLDEDFEIEEDLSQDLTYERWGDLDDRDG